MASRPVIESLVARKSQTSQSSLRMLGGIWTNVRGSSIGAHRALHNMNADPLKSLEGFRVYRTLNLFGHPLANLERKLSRQGFVSWRELRIGSASGLGNVGQRSASTTSEAIANLKQGLYVDSYMLVDILKSCSKQKDLVGARKLHESINQSGMDKNLYVMNTLLNVYIRCGRLQDARRLFHNLENRDVVTWRMMIAGYAASNRTEDAMELFNQMIQAGLQPNEITCLTILKACTSPSALKWGEEVHAYIRHAGFDSTMRVGSALVHMYAKCGCITEARRVFESLTERDIVTWNVMIGACTDSGSGVEAYELFLQMKREGLAPNAITYMSILNASASAGALEWVKEVHGHASRDGLELDLRVGNALVHMYAKSGSLDDAREVFERMEQRDVITWNIMIGASAESGVGEEAYQLFLRMKEEGFIPNSITYVNVLNAPATADALGWVKKVHGHAQRGGLELDLRVGNALVRRYARSGSLADARLVFFRMEKRDVITWNIMIGACAERDNGVEAYRLFLEMQREGFKPDAITYVSILNASASIGALEWVREVHRHARGAGLESDLRVGNALVHMYAKTGSIKDAREVFDRMKKRDVTTWTIMIGAYAENDARGEAYRLFLQMKREGFIPNAITYINILNASASGGGLDWVKEVHGHALRDGLLSDSRVSNALIHMYAKSGSLEDARLVFVGMEKRVVITWNTMIGAYAERGCGPEAYRLFLQMKREGFNPDAITYLSILNASASAGALEWVKELHKHAVRAGLESDLRVSNALVHMYAKSGSIGDAQLLFDRMKKRDVVTWNIMIGGLAQHGCGQEALELFRQMIADGVKPDETSLVAVLSACCHAGLVDDGRRLFSHMRQDFGVEPTVLHYNCMVDLLGRAGQLEEAERLIGGMPVEPDGITWKALLGACRSYKNVELGERASNEVLKLDPKDSSAYVLLSNIYAAAGKWEKVSSVRRMMQERGVRKEAGRSWIEVGNKIHEFVVGDTSHPESKEIYTELNILTEKLKAEGYIADTQAILRNIDEEDKQLALCSHSEKLAIAYGLMHTPSGEPIRVYKNLRVCSDCHRATRFISKVTGREIIARDAVRFHHFKDGMCSCGDYW